MITFRWAPAYRYSYNLRVEEMESMIIKKMFPIAVMLLLLGTPFSFADTVQYFYDDLEQTGTS